jgi:ATP-dependent DNA helicase RecQ
MKKLEVLQKYFGHSKFRKNQEAAIDAILDGQDLLMILPTGGGKSLCYQLPSLVMDGVSVVISPLLALMHDQVMALQNSGIEAKMLSSMQTLQESKTIEQELKSGKIKLLYISPEKLGNEYFLNLLKGIKINFFVVDEAHCVSQWGHEFREHYRMLHILKEHFSNTSIAAFTATATHMVQEDIIASLRLKSPKIIKGVVFRENLFLQADYKLGDGKAQLVQFLKEQKGAAGIVYAFSRKQCESLAKYLQERGFLAKAFHANMPNEEKKEVFKAFLNDEIEIVVATIAFGMGIDKSNIRFVVHMNMPKSIEGYYQEIGRAGRDGLEAKTLLLFSTQDIIQQKRFIEELPEGIYKKSAYEKLNAMYKYASSQACRHKAIAAYFGDTIEPCKSHCDNCLEANKNAIDITKAAQMLLSAIYRTKQSFGIHYVIDVLRGSLDKRILTNKHNELSVYGIGKEHSKAWWLSIADRLLELEAVGIGEFKVYFLTKKGVAILKGQESVSINEKRLQISKASKKSKKEPSEPLEFEDRVFEALRALRKEIATKEGVPPYIVFSDKTLKELASYLPSTKEQMLQINGIGEVKFQKYGEAFLEALKEFIVT